MAEGDDRIGHTDYWSGICCRVLAAGEFVRVHGLLSATDMCRSGLLERCPINDSNQRSAAL